MKGDNWEIRIGRWQDSSPEAVDHVISDPPYNAGTHKGASVQLRRPGGFSFEAIKPKEIAGLLVGIARRWALCFCAAEALGDYSEGANGPWTLGGCYVRSGFYMKSNPMPQFTGDRPAMGAEAMAIMHGRAKGTKLRWNGGGKAAVWRGPSVMSGRVHETQKPLWLMRALVEAFTDPGDLVWDPYGGSMTTGVACLQLGRRFIGQ